MSRVLVLVLQLKDRNGYYRRDKSHEMEDGAPSSKRYKSQENGKPRVKPAAVPAPAPLSEDDSDLGSESQGR